MLTFGSPQGWHLLIAFFLENFLGSPDFFCMLNTFGLYPKHSECYVATQSC